MTSRARLAVVSLVVLAGGLALCTGFAEEKAAPPAGRTWFAGVDAAIYSDYIWRGVNKYDTSVSPAVYVKFPSFCVKALGLFETGEDAGTGEIDLSLEYFFSLGQLNFSAGYIYYGYDESPYSDTSELFGKAAWRTGTPIVPSLELYWDVDEASALYARIGVAYEDQIENVPFKVATALGGATEGFAETYFWVSEAAFIDFEASFSMVIPLSKQISFEPFVGISVLLDDSIKTWVKDDTNEYLGAALHLVF